MSVDSSISGATAADWARRAITALCDGGETVRYAALCEWMGRSTPPPPALVRAWERDVWPLPGEPAALHFLRCVANTAMTAEPLLLDLLSFPPDAVECVWADPAALDWEAAEGEDEDEDEAWREGRWDESAARWMDGALHRGVVRVVALRLAPSTTDVVQVGWCGPSPRPAYYSRTHFVLQLPGGHRCAAWAYGALGRRVRLGALWDAILHAAATGDRRAAVVLHSAADVAGGRAPLRRPVSAARASFAQLVADFAPDIAGQSTCKALLVLVAAHTLYRGRHPGRRPLHLLLSGPPRSGRSALLRAVRRLLGARGALLAPHVLRGEAGEGGGLLFGAACRADALVVDGPPQRATLAALLAGCVAPRAACAEWAPTASQVTAAAPTAEAPPLAAHTPLFARTSARLSARGAMRVGDGVLAAQRAARSATPSRALAAGASLRRAMDSAEAPHVLEAAIPPKWMDASAADAEAVPMAALGAVWRELCVARLAMEADGVWGDALEAEVWNCYAHHMRAYAEVRRRTPGESGVGVRRNARGGRRGACVALLRRLTEEQRARRGEPISTGMARQLYAQLGGEAATGQSFGDAMQHLIEGAFVIRRRDAYAVIGEP